MKSLTGGGPHPLAALPSAKVEGLNTEALVSPLTAQPCVQLHSALRDHA